MFKKEVVRVCLSKNWVKITKGEKQDRPIIIIIKVIWGKHLSIKSFKKLIKCNMLAAVLQHFDIG